MALTKEEKKNIIEDVRQKMSSQTVVYFVNYKGLKTRDVEILRKKLKEEDAVIMVSKKTLTKRAFQEEGIDFDPETLQGEIAFVFCFGDIVSPAKILKDFAKDSNIEILGALLEKEALSSERVEKLAELPTKEQLRGQLVSTIAAPLSGFVTVLEGNIKGLLNVLKQKAEK